MESIDDSEFLTTVLVRLTERGIPADVQELLLRGDNRGTVAPGALLYALRPLIDQSEDFRKRCISLGEMLNDERRSHSDLSWQINADRQGGL